MHSESACRLCRALAGNPEVEVYRSVCAIEDRYPVTPGHYLVIPRRHTADWFTMTGAERRDAQQLLQILAEKLRAMDPLITGFNIGMNCGKSAGQTIYHAHLHLIPRRDGDTPDPAGGVRGVIPDKRRYPLLP